MAALYSSQNSTNKESTVYETCKEVIESRKPLQQKWKSQNKNLFEACKLYAERQQKKVSNLDRELQSAEEKTSTKSELFVENIQTLLEKPFNVNQDASAKKIDSNLNKECTELDSLLNSQMLNTESVKCPKQLFLCSKCDAKFEDRLELVSHWQRSHVTKRGRRGIPMECNLCQKIFPSKKKHYIHYQSHLAENNQEKVNDINGKISTKPELVAKNKNSFLKILPADESLRDKVPVVYLPEKNTLTIYCNESAKKKLCLKNQINKTKISACPKCDAKFGKEIDMVLHFEEYHLKARKLIAKPVDNNLSHNVNPSKEDDVHFQSHPVENQHQLKTECFQCPECDSKFEDILKLGLHFKHSHLKNFEGPSSVLRSSEIAAPQEDQNSTNENPVDESDLEFEEILDSEQTLDENRGSSCSELKSFEIDIPQGDKDSNLRSTVKDCDAKVQVKLGSEMPLEQNNLKNKSSEVVALQETQNSSNKGLSVYESCKKILEVRNHIQKTLSLKNSLDFEMISDKQQNCISLNKNSINQAIPVECNLSQSHAPKAQEQVSNYQEVETQSSSVEKISNKSDLFDRNLSSSLNKVPVLDQGSKSNSGLNSQNLNMLLFACHKCDIEFKEKTALTNHIYEYHPQRKPYKKTQPKPFKCKLCQKIFHRKLEYKIHAQIHSFIHERKEPQNTPVECDICQSIFPNCEDYSIHFQSHFPKSQEKKSNDIKVETQSSSIEKISNKSYWFSKNLNKYIILLNKVPVLDQDLSGKKDNSTSNKESSEVPQDLKTELLCLICDIRFKGESELAMHQYEYHTKKGAPNKPVECKLCQKIFPRRIDYNIHLRIHSEIKEPQTAPVKCKFCQKIFPRRKDYAIHLKKKHPKRKSRGRQAVPAECKSCDMTFPSKKDFDIHFRTHSESLKVKKPRRSVWDDCKKVLTEKPQQAPSANPLRVVLKFPISKRVAFTNNSPGEIESPKTLSHKMEVSNFSSLLPDHSDCEPDEPQLDKLQNLDGLQSDNLVHIKTEAMEVAEMDGCLNSISSDCDSAQFKTLDFPSVNLVHFKAEVMDVAEMDNSNVSPNIDGLQSDNLVHIKTEAMEAAEVDGCLNSISSDCDSVEFKTFEDFPSVNLVHFKAEIMDMAETDNSNVSCNICGASFEGIEEYEFHYSTHLDKELCQIKEGDEELHVCNICGGCFIEINTFQAHTLTHIKKELPDE